MSELILAIDQGTTGTTSLILDFSRGAAEIKGRGYAEFAQHFPQPGWVEHDLNQIWDSVTISIHGALEAAGVKGDAIGAIGITNQRETIGVWDENGQPLRNAIVWQDRRTAEICAGLKAADREAEVRAKTGLLLDPYFSGTKLGWILSEESELRVRARAKKVRVGTMDTWLLWKLTQGASYKTDVTNASRTLLFDIHKGVWDESLAGMCSEVPVDILPEVFGCDDRFGETLGVPGLRDGIPILGIAGDQQASLFGQACFLPGMLKCTYGTGAFALVNTGEQAIQSDAGLLTTIAWKVGGKTHYAIEGSVFVAGAIVQWLRDGLGFFQSSAEVEDLANTVEDTGGVMLVPALTGLGAPHWNPDARGIISGLTRGTNRAHLARAALEGIAWQVYELVGAMGKGVGANNAEILRVDGGATANNFLMQFQADILGRSIERPKVLDTTALGAAYLAALGLGAVADQAAITTERQMDRVFEPSMGVEQVRERFAQWQNAVAKA